MTILTILPHAESDLPIPPVAQIAERVHELAADAWRQQDTETYRRMVNLSDALNGGMRMVWNLGDLLVTSASTPGVVYTVSCGHCTCPAWKPCKHLALAEVLLEMLDTQAGDSDFEADADELEAPLWTVGAVLGRRLACDPPDEPCPLGGDEGDELPSGRAMGARLCAARSTRYAAL